MRNTTIKSVGAVRQNGGQKQAMGPQDRQTILSEVKRALDQRKNTSGEDGIGGFGWEQIKEAVLSKLEKNLNLAVDCLLDEKKLDDLIGNVLCELVNQRFGIRSVTKEEPKAPRLRSVEDDNRRGVGRQFSEGGKIRGDSRLPITDGMRLPSGFDKLDLSKTIGKKEVRTAEESRAQGSRAERNNVGEEPEEFDKTTEVSTRPLFPIGGTSLTQRTCKSAIYFDVSSTTTYRYLSEKKDISVSEKADAAVSVAGGGSLRANDSLTVKKARAAANAQLARIQIAATRSIDTLVDRIIARLLERDEVKALVKQIDDRYAELGERADRLAEELSKQWKAKEIRNFDELKRALANSGEKLSLPDDLISKIKRQLENNHTRKLKKLLKQLLIEEKSGFPEFYEKLRECEKERSELKKKELNNKRTLKILGWFAKWKDPSAQEVLEETDKAQIHAKSARLAIANKEEELSSQIGEGIKKVDDFVKELRNVAMEALTGFEAFGVTEPEIEQLFSKKLEETHYKQYLASKDEHAKRQKGPVAFAV